MRLSIVFAALVSILAFGLAGTAEARPHNKSHAHARSKHKHKRARASAKHHTAQHSRHARR